MKKRFVNVKRVNNLKFYEMFLIQFFKYTKNILINI